MSPYLAALISKAQRVLVESFFFQDEYKIFAFHGLNSFTRFLIRFFNLAANLVVFNFFCVYLAWF